MHRARKRRFKRRERKAPFIGRLLRRRFGLEQICDDCSWPYLDRNADAPKETFLAGSVVAEVYEEHCFGKTNYYVRIGRCGSDRYGLFTCQMLLPGHLDDVAKVISQADAFIRGQKPLRLASRK